MAFEGNYSMKFSGKFLLLKKQMLTKLTELLSELTQLIEFSLIACINSTCTHMFTL